MSGGPHESFNIDFETNCTGGINSRSSHQAGNNKRKRESVRERLGGIVERQCRHKVRDHQRCRVKAIIEFDYLPVRLAVKMLCH